MIMAPLFFQIAIQDFGAIRHVRQALKDLYWRNYDPGSDRPICTLSWPEVGPLKGWA